MLRRWLGLHKEQPARIGNPFETTPKDILHAAPWPQAQNMIKCLGCGLTVARFNEHLICPNCESEAK